MVGGKLPIDVRGAGEAHKLGRRALRESGAPEGSLVGALRSGGDVISRAAHGVSLRANSHASSAFCACNMLSASSHTADCGPAMTSAATSYPRYAGRQCRKIAVGADAAIVAGVT